MGFVHFFAFFEGKAMKASAKRPKTFGKQKLFQKIWLQGVVFAV
jgi:hypothetical protein